MNYYEILGVGPDATDQAIKEGYRREAMKWHPDRHTGAAAKGEADRRFKDLAVAYRTLRNPSARADYDRQLEQQLRREFEARQQAQEKQKRAQSDQASKQQAGAKQERHDFADTKSPFEEDTTSSAEANQMFYEQMLDLAFELAGRGFPEFNIYKALIALGCPENIARSVTESAIRSAGQQTGPSDNPQSGGADGTRTVSPDFLETASWGVVAPYYAAAIGGVHAVDRMGDEEYGPIFERNSRQFNSYGVSLLLVIVGGLLAFIYSSIGAAVAVLGGLCFLGTAIWRVFTSDARFRREKAIRYYLTVFECFHTARPLQFKLQKWNPWGGLFTFGWLAYRRMPIFALVGTAFWLILYYLFSVLTKDTESEKLVLALLISLPYLPGIIFGFFSNRIYYDSVRKKISKALSAPQKQSLILLREKGGKSYLAVIAVFTLSIILGLPAQGILAEATLRRLVAEEARQHAAEKTANEARQSAVSAKTQAELDQVIAQIEATHAELNEKSPTFNKAAVDWILAHQKSYIDQGQTPVNALKLAVADYDTGLQQQNQLGQTDVRTESTPPLDRYIAYIKSLPTQDQFQQVYSDMDSKFPTLLGKLTVAQSGFTPQHFSQASLVEETQTWSHRGRNSENNGYIVFQNRTYQELKGIVLEVQAEERGCDNKGKVYYLNLLFDKPVASAAVVGVRFSFPAYIQNANRCMDVVDLIFD